MLDLDKFKGHTPGKWSIDPEHDGDVQGDGKEICIIWSKNDRGITVSVPMDAPNPPKHEADANARLIAAAPELLAEVKRLREALRDIRDQNTIEMAHDPQWAARIARQALGGPNV